MSEHVDRFSYIQKRTKPIGKKKKNIVPSTRLKAVLSKERGESIKLLSKTETHNHATKVFLETGVVLRCCNWASIG